MTDQQSGMDRDRETEREQGGTEDLGSGGREYGRGMGTGSDYGGGEGGTGDVGGQTDMGGGRTDIDRGQTDIGGGQDGLTDWQRDRNEEQGGKL